MPGLLRFVGSTSIFSVIGFLVFAVGKALTTSSFDHEVFDMVYATILHFVIPLGAFFTVTSNSPLSRAVIAAYAVALSAAALLGKGFFGRIEVDQDILNTVAVVFAALVFGWLFRSPKMRYYYAAVSGRPIPDDLADRAAELQPKPYLPSTVRNFIAWILDHLETVVLFGLIVLTVVAVAHVLTI